jgi:hypothetical protein
VSEAAGREEERKWKPLELQGKIVRTRFREAEAGRRRQYAPVRAVQALRNIALSISISFFISASSFELLVLLSTSSVSVTGAAASLAAKRKETRREMKVKKRCGKEVPKTRRRELASKA